MKYIINLSSALVILLVVVQSCCCPCYFTQTYSNTDDVKAKVTALVSHSTDSIFRYNEEIAVTRDVIDNAINANKSRRGCRQVQQQWNLLSNADSIGAFDVFLKEWRKSRILPDMYAQSSLRQISDILNQIRETEDIIKEKRKPCK